MTLGDPYKFAVRSGGEVRILASRELEYIAAEGRCDLSRLDISEAVISSDELCDIISKLGTKLNISI